MIILHGTYYNFYRSCPFLFVLPKILLLATLLIYFIVINIIILKVLRRSDTILGNTNKHIMFAVCLGNE
jgi:hypothetical protein